MTFPYKILGVLSVTGESEINRAGDAFMESSKSKGYGLSSIRGVLREDFNGLRLNRSIILDVRPPDYSR